MSDVLVAVVVLVAKPPTVRATTQDHVFTTAFLLGSSTVFELLFENSLRAYRYLSTRRLDQFFFAGTKIQGLTWMSIEFHSMKL